MNKKTILFLCTGNSCRSQMAEGLTRYFKSNIFNVYSAGIETHGLNKNAVTVMAEIGIDISRQQSKTTEDLPKIDFDFVVTVCDSANENCPFFPAMTKLVHHGFQDPPSLTADLPDGEEKLNAYRKVRDEIKDFIQTLPESILN